jgi:RNA polymerase sigma factor (sigma-70 family)
VDESTIRAFVERDYRRVVGLVRVVCGDLGLAEDAVQDAILKAWDSRSPVEHPAAWITAVALNRTRDVGRRRRAEQRAYGRMHALRGRRSGSTPSEEIEHRSFGDLDQRVRSLPRLQREIVILVYFFDMSVADVASSLRVNEGTVKTSLYRARQSLSAAMGVTNDFAE